MTNTEKAMIMEESLHTVPGMMTDMVDEEEVDTSTVVDAIQNLATTTAGMMI